MTQKQRVLAALKAHPEGIDRTQFLAPDVIDDGDPIINIPARIEELRTEGHKIVDAGRRHKCEVYRLVTLAVAPDAVYHVVCDACGHRTEQYEPYALPCDCGAPLHWVGIYTSELNARRHTPFKRIQVQTRRAA